MKKLLLIMFVILFLASCGPHRMSCGPRGICKVSGEQIITLSKINHSKSTVKI